MTTYIYNTTTHYKLIETI